MSSQANELSLDAVKKLLDSGDFDQFVGKIEGDYFEAKQQRPYKIDSSDSNERFSARVELSGDIASVANAKGGYVVCGLTTEKETDLQTDIVKKINLFDKASFYTQEIIQEVVNTHIVPELKIVTTWYPSKTGKTKGLGAIYIPRQVESKKHFLVTAVEVNGAKQKHFVSIPIRQGSEPIWMSAKQIYRHAASKKPNELKQIHDSLTGQIEELRGILLTGKGIASPADDLPRKIKEVLDVH